MSHFRLRAYPRTGIAVWASRLPAGSRIRSKPNTKLIVTVIPDPADQERDDWGRMALQNLARAYGPDEPEYSPDDIKEVN